MPSTDCNHKTKKKKNKHICQYAAMHVICFYFCKTFYPYVCALKQWCLTKVPTVVLAICKILSISSTYAWCWHSNYNVHISYVHTCVCYINIICSRHNKCKHFNIIIILKKMWPTRSVLLSRCGFEAYSDIIIYHQ